MNVTVFEDPSTSQTKVTQNDTPLQLLNNLMVGAPDAPLDVLSRAYQVASYSWVPGQAAGTLLGTINFPDALFAIPLIQDKLKNFRYFRAGVEFNVLVNGNKMLYGALAVGLDPCTSLDNTAGAEVNLFSVLNGPSLIVYAATGETPYMKIPYLYPLPALDLATYDSGSIGSVDVLVFNPLTAISASAATASLTVTVNARFVDPMLDGPTQDTTLAAPVAIVRTAATVLP